MTDGMHRYTPFGAFTEEHGYERVGNPVALAESEEDGYAYAQAVRYRGVPQIAIAQVVTPDAEFWKAGEEAQPVTIQYAHLSQPDVQQMLNLLQEAS